MVSLKSLKKALLRNLNVKRGYLAQQKGLSKSQKQRCHTCNKAQIQRGGL